MRAHDAEQRAMIEERVEENRGLRADVKLMQQANAEQREEIERLRGLLSRLGYEVAGALYMRQHEISNFYW